MVEMEKTVETVKMELRELLLKQLLLEILYLELIPIPLFSLMKTTVELIFSGNMIQKIIKSEIT